MIIQPNKMIICELSFSLKFTLISFHGLDCFVSAADNVVVAAAAATASVIELGSVYELIQMDCVYVYSINIYT